MNTLLDTLFFHLHPSFCDYNWRLCDSASNKLCYTNADQSDEFIIATEPHSSDIAVSIPVKDVSYKSIFPYKDMNSVVAYVKQHLEWYEA
jgi:hypothetical protein